MPKPWYVTSFGEHYLELYGHRNEREAEQALALLDLAAADPARGPLLDLACGGGRHLAGLGRRGFRAVGLDLSPALLADARRRLRPGLGIVRGDMRQLPFADRSFAGALSMFTSFGYFPVDSENWRMPAEVARVLKPGAWFLFDFLNRQQLRRELRASSRRESAQWVAVETRSIAGAPGEERVLKRVEIHPRTGGGDALVYQESVRLFGPEELSTGFARLGFREERRWGSYGGADFDAAQSPRFIVLLRLETP